MSTSMNVILPQKRLLQESNDKFPVLYPLYGLSDDHTVWMRRTSIERYIEPLGLAAVMPQVPSLYQCCGTEDFLYEDNIGFRDFCREQGIELTPGTHEWGYWDKKIQMVLEWFMEGKQD